MREPDVLKSYSYDDLLTAHIAYLKSLLPNYAPSSGDLLMIETEASAYRELLLRAEFNSLAKAFFISTATGADLDNYALFYGVERLQGAKPTALYSFELVAPLSYEVSIPKGATLVDDGGEYIGVLLESATFRAGEEVATARVELQHYTSYSEIELTTLQNPLPYISTVEKKEPFSAGAEIEDDKSFRKRILLSLADKSTAGSEMTYKSYTYSADARVEDVKVFNDVGTLDDYVSNFIEKNEQEVLEALRNLFADFCTVKVIIYAPTDADETAVQRVTEALNSSDVRPLTDRVKVQKAKEVNFDVVATLYIFPNRNISEVYTNALSSLDTGLKSLRKIGVDISQSELNDFLRVDGVKKVKITSPLDMAIDRESIAIVRDIAVQNEVYYEQL